MIEYILQVLEYAGIVGGWFFLFIFLFWPSYFHPSTDSQEQD